VKPSLLLFLFLTTFFGVYSQDDYNIKISEVTIQSNRIETTYDDLNSTVFVFTRQQIEQMPVQSLNEVLGYIAGVDMQQRGPFGVQSDVSLRGGTFEQTLILVNGIKMSDPQTGHHNLNLPIDLDQVERIEVMKGSASRIYGINALTGAINIITKVPKEPVLKAGVIAGSDLRQGAGDQSHLNFGADLGIAYGKGSYKAYTYVGHDRSSGYQPNTDYAQYKAFYQGEITGVNRQTSLMASYLNNSFGANSFYAFPFDTGSWERVNTALVSAQHKQIINRWTLTPRIYWRNNTDDYLLRRDDPSFFKNEHSTNVLGAEFHTAWSNKIGALGLGLDIRQEWIRSNNLGDHERFNFGLFAEHRFVSIADIIDLNAGIYLNYNSEVGVRVYPGMDVGIRLTEGLKLFAEVGTGLRQPTYTDLYYNGPSNIGNPNLEPEEALSYELGFKLASGIITANASFFSRRTTGLIDWVRDSLTAPWQPQNFEEVIVSGVDLGFQVHNPRVNYYKGGISTLGIQYTYLDPSLKGDDAVISRYSLNQLEHQFITHLDYKFAHFVYHSIKVRFIDRLENESYWLLDTRLAFKKENVSVFFDIHNLLNTQYIESGMVTMPGRWYRVGLNFDIDLGRAAR
jgi:iron complex outermembrane receptor protein